MTRQVDDVNELLDHLSAGLRAFAPPVCVQGVAVELTREQARPTRFATLRRRVPTRDRRAEAVHEPASCDDASLCGSIDHRPRTRHVQRDRLLDQYVSSGGDRLLNLTGVRERRQRDDQQIDLRIQHAPQIGERCGPEAGSKLLNFAVAATTTGDQLHLILQDAYSSRMTRGDSAAAEHADAQTLHTQAPKSGPTATCRVRPHRAARTAPAPLRMRPYG